MRSLAWILVMLVACGTDDPRQPTVEVISLEILAPGCGAPQCHSTSTNQSGYAFDTLAAAKVSLRQLVGPATGGKDHHSLMEVLTSTGGKLMPPDAPLDPADIKLIETWIADGAQGL